MEKKNSTEELKRLLQQQRDKVDREIEDAEATKAVEDRDSDDAEEVSYQAAFKPSPFESSQFEPFPGPQFNSEFSTPPLYTAPEPMVMYPGVPATAAQADVVQAGGRKPRKRSVGLVLGFPLLPLWALGIHHFYFRRPGAGIATLLLWTTGVSSNSDSLQLAAFVWAIVEFILLVRRTPRYQTDGKDVPIL